jgi:hypothetical protein
VEGVIQMKTAVVEKVRSWDSFVEEPKYSLWKKFRMWFGTKFLGECWFLGVRFPVVKLDKPLPSLMDKIEPIEPLVLSDAEVEAMNKRIREKLGVEIVFVPGVPIGKGIYGA